MFSVERVVIYSVGLLGGSLGAALKQSGFSGEIIGISSKRGRENALRAGVIDTAFSYEETEQVLRSNDLVFLCSPITGILTALQKLSAMNLPENLLITDVGSTKSTIVKTAQELLPPSVCFVGGHPMTGSEKSGPQHSDPLLFQNAVYVLTPEENTEPADFLEDFLVQYTGARVRRFDPLVHDEIAATISHVPHIIAVGLVDLAAEINRKNHGTLSLAAGGFKSVTRIASSPYKMWHDIFATNKGAVSTILSSYISILQEMQEELAQNTLEDRFEKARQTRAHLTANRKGFLSPLYEIVVLAADEPGFLAQMTRTIDMARLNIRDIELLKVREGEAGTFMLAFSSRGDAEKAIRCLKKSGFTAWMMEE
ncbi:MAG: prephenate dehydrogenase/arogenate dehydrogenase family protein [Fibrobacterota bacterium]